MEREEYLRTARDNAIEAAARISALEDLVPASRRGDLIQKRLELNELAAEYQMELITIDAQHVSVDRPTEEDIEKMAELRDRVSNATSANLATAAIISIADEVIAKIDEVRGIA